MENTRKPQSLEEEMVCLGYDIAPLPLEPKPIDRGAYNLGLELHHIGRHLNARGIMFLYNVILNESRARENEIFKSELPGAIADTDEKLAEKQAQMKRLCAILNEKPYVAEILPYLRELRTALVEPEKELARIRAE
jgi:hypothetical protein